MNSTFKLVERAAIQIAGLTVQTDMVHAAQDCPALWQRYGLRLEALVACKNKPVLHESYGVSVMQNEKQFVYWAADEYTSLDALPDDFQAMTLPGGVYVC